MPWDSLGHTRSRSSPPSNDPNIACPGTAKIVPSPALAGLPKLPDTFSIQGDADFFQQKLCRLGVSVRIYLKG